jgi:hypothetical protein
MCGRLEAWRARRRTVIVLSCAVTSSSVFGRLFVRFELVRVTVNRALNGSLFLDPWL